MAIRVVRDVVLLAHLDEDVVDGHGRALLQAILADIVRRRSRRQTRLREHLGEGHPVLAAQDTVDVEAAVGRAGGAAGQVRLVDSGPHRGRVIDRRARVEVGGGRVVVADVEE